MQIKIEPRKSTDRGGFYCMPLRVNVPKTKNKDWELTHCPECGAECWRNPALAKIVETQGAKGLCTVCALKKGLMAEPVQREVQTCPGCRQRTLVICREDSSGYCTNCGCIIRRKRT